MNNSPVEKSEFYLGTPVRTQQMIDEFKSADIINIDNSSITDSTGTYRQIQIAVTDPVTAPTAGANKAEVRIPFDAVLVGAYSNLTTAPTAGANQVTLKNSSGQDILIGYLQMSTGQTTSNAGTIDANKSVFLRNEPIRITVNSVGTTAKGLIVTLYFVVANFYTT
jgi:hypothetical protein